MKLKKFLPLIGITLFFYIIYRVGLDKLWTALRQANVYYLLLSLVFLVPITLIQVYKWRYLLRRQGIKTSFKDLTKIFLIGDYYGFLTPGRLGSLIRISYIQEKENIEVEKASSSVIIDRIMDVIALLILAAIGSILLAKYFTSLYIGIMIVSVGFILLFLIFMNKKLTRFFLKKLVYKYLVPNRLKEKARYSFHKFYDNLPKLRYMIIPFILSLISFIILYSRGYIVALAFGIQIPFIYYITMVAISTVISLIPITISGFGTREASLITLFSIFGIGPSRVVAFSLTSYLTASLPVLLGLYFSTKTVRTGQLK